MLTTIVIAKRPVPGQVKTRLTPPLTPSQAGAVAGAALADTLRAVTEMRTDHRILAISGDPTGWLPTGWETTPQPDGSLDTRLVSAFGAAGGGPAVLVGMDTPQLRGEQLEQFDPGAYDVCLGLANDGGYWSIGFADPAAHAAATINGIPMSTPHTGRAQLRRLRELGLRVQLLAALTDVDTIADARHVAAIAPHTAFAAALRSIESACVPA